MMTAMTCGVSPGCRKAKTKGGGDGDDAVGKDTFNTMRTHVGRKLSSMTYVVGNIWAVALVMDSNVCKEQADSTSSALASQSGLITF